MAIRLIYLIPTGEENAITAKSLKSLLGYKTERTVTQNIEKLRQRGIPILAVNKGCNGDNGYFLPANRGEAARYIRTLDSRERSIRRNSLPARRYIKTGEWSFGNAQH